MSPRPDRGSAAAPQDVAATTGNVTIRWDNAALQAIRVTRLGPPIVARALAIAHTAMYDACAAYDDQAVGTLASKNEAVSFAAYRALVDLFPTQTPLFNDLMASLGYDPENRSTDVVTAAGVGNVVAAAVIAFRHHAYDYVRPVTAVHFLFAGKKVRAWAGPYRGTRVIDGAD